MTEEKYLKITENIRRNKKLVRLINFLDKTITIMTVVLYLAILVIAFFSTTNSDYTLLYRSILIPGVSFVVLSIFRYMISAKRPYEVYNFIPIIEKDTVKKSFPSRHVFSMFIVAMTYMQLSFAGGMLIMCMGILLAFIRVVGGVHFIRDVVVGALIGLLCGFIGYYILGECLGRCVLIL